jgi:hypothetical protein
MKVYSLTFNDDYSTPYCEVFATRDRAVTYLFDYLEIEAEDRQALFDKIESGEFEDEDLNPFKKNDYDSYTLQEHDLETGEVELVL